MKKIYNFFAIVLVVISGISFRSLAQTYTFPCGTMSTWTVPAGVTSLTFDVRGGEGGQNDGFTTFDRGGYGARVQGTLAVTPGQILYIYVGGAGANGIYLSAAGGVGGYNGGGSGLYYYDGFNFYAGGGGGGASDIRIGGTALTNRVIVAGGGGGAGENGFTTNADRGGDGGGTTGQNGVGFYAGEFGYGGTPAAGGAGGVDVVTFTYASGGNGALGVGGTGGYGSPSGGGGGGYYGGGGGVWEGGGGGSSYTDPVLVTGVTHTRGYNTTGCGSVTLTNACSAGTITGTGIVCQGSTTTLADATTGGTWSSSNGLIASVAGGLVTGVAGGTAVISYIMPAGCYATSVVTVNPSAAPISGLASVCQGQTITLTESVAGGVWASSTTSVATVAGGVVSGAAGGTATISYSMPGCSPVTDIVTVNPISPITGSLTLCSGTTTTLSDATAGGTWSSSNLAVGTVAGGVVSGLSAGVSTIVFTGPGGCTASVVVTVNASAAALAGPGTVCQGQTITLTESVAGGTWASSLTSVGTVAGGVVTGIGGGTTTISYTMPSCNTVTQVVTVNPITMVTGTFTVCSGATTTLSDATAGGTWGSSNIAVATVTGGVVSGLAAGTATIIYTGPSGGCSAAAIVTVYATPSSIGGTLSVCAGQTTTLTNTLAGVSWSSLNTGIAAISGGGVVTGVSAGTATIVCLGPAGGCSSGAIVTVNPAPGGITGSLSICQGLTTTLGNTITGGTWSSGNPGVATIVSGAGLVTGISGGTSIITYVATGSCSATAVLTVNPAPSAIGGTAAVCAGSTTALTNTVAGGTWSTAGSPGIATVVAGTGVVSGVGAGTILISYTTATCNPVQTVVTVNPSPAPIGGTLTLCTGYTTTLNGSVGGGTWLSGSTAIAPIGFGTGTAFGMSAGTSVITYTLPTSCAATAVLTVNASPQGITGVTSTCIGFTSSLSDFTPGGTWSSSVAGAGIGTVSGAGVVSGISAGSTTITYTMPTGCTATLGFTVNPLPAGITGVTDGCVGFSATLSDPNPGGSWLSSLPAVADIGSASGVVTGYMTGTTTITYILPTGCYTTRTETVDPSPVAISGASNVCQGTISFYTDGTPGGSWVSSATGVAVVGSNTGILLGVSPGMTTISYSLPTGCYVAIPVMVNMPPGAISGPSTVCVGSAMTLADPVSGGAWTSTSAPGTASVGASSGIVTGVAAGNVVVSYTMFGCNPATYTISVDPVPAAITGVGNLCIGTSTTLSETTPGGAWSSSNVAVGISSAGVVSGLSAGPGTVISYTLPTGCYVTAPVVVFPSPGPIHGIDSVCQGSSTMLTDSISGGAWSSSDGTIATAIAFTGEVIGAHAGTVHITYTLVSGCYVDTLFKVNAPVPASLSVTTDPPDTMVCAGQSVLFSAHPVNGGPGATFSWKVFVPGGPSGTGLNFPYAPSHWDYVECTMFPGGICALPDSVKAAVTMNVFPDVTPVVKIYANLPNDTITYLGELVTFESNITSGGVSPSYQWYKDGSAIAGATSASYSTRIYDVNDTFYLKVVATSPCDSSLTRLSDTLIIYSNSYLAVKTANSINGSLSLYPNPNNGSFTLSGKCAGDKEMNIEVADMLGRTVYTGKTTPVNRVIHKDIALPGEMAAGTYMLRVHSDTETEIFHFVIGK